MTPRLYFVLILLFSISLSTWADCYQVAALLGAPRSVCQAAWNGVVKGKCQQYESTATSWSGSIERSEPTANNEIIYSISLSYDSEGFLQRIPMKIIFNPNNQTAIVQGYCCGYGRCDGDILW